VNGQVPTAVVNEDGTWTLAWQPNGTGADKYYTQSFTLASSVTVTHNLGKYPSVTVKDSAGTSYMITPTYIDLNTLLVEFGASFSGTVICN
jgi:hypothetical protein